MKPKKKPERRSEEQYEEWKRKNKKWLESIMKSDNPTPN